MLGFIFPGSLPAMYLLFDVIVSLQRYDDN